MEIQVYGGLSTVLRYFNLSATVLSQVIQDGGSYLQWRYAVINGCTFSK